MSKGHKFAIFSGVSVASVILLAIWLSAPLWFSAAMALLMGVTYYALWRTR